MRLGCLPAAARSHADRFVRARRGPHPLPGDARGHGPDRGVPPERAGGVHEPLPAGQRPPVHTGPPGFLDAFFYRYIVGFSNRCSYVTAPTATALGLLREHGLRVPSGVVSNGVDLRRYSPGPADDRIRQRYGLGAGRPLILSVGRLSPEKRSASCWTPRPGRTPESSSPSPAPDRTRRGCGHTRAARRRREGAVPWLRPRGRPPGLYRLADVFAIASEAELQSLTTMEAMATGLPVVAVNAARSANWSATGRTGSWLVRATPPRWQPAGPALRRPRDAAHHVRGAARIISVHDGDRCLTAWESLYRALRPARAEASDDPSSRPPVPLLFLIGDNGGGHRSAANAVAQALDRLWPGRFAPVICDPLLGPDAPRWLRWLVGMYGPMIRRWPWLWGVLWRVYGSPRRSAGSGGHPGARLPHRRQSRRGQAARHDRLLPSDDRRARRARARRRGRRPPVITVITDLVTAHLAWRDAAVDRVIAPSAAMAGSLPQQGMPEGALRRPGCPSRPSSAGRRCGRRSAARCAALWACAGGSWSS